MSGRAGETQANAAPRDGWDFDAHTAVEGSGDGRWRAEIDEGLSGFGGTHGGYLAALALRAMGLAVGDPARAPRSLTMQLLSRVTPGAIELAPRVEHAGGSVTFASLRIEQEAATVAAALASFGLPGRSPAHTGVRMPDVPPPERCEPIAKKPVAEARAGLLVEYRPAAPPLPLSGGEHAQILTWMRLIEERPLDALSACMLADAAPPALYGMLSEFVAMPSAEISVHFAEAPESAPGPWVLGAFRTSRAADGYASEDGELWTPDGRLLLGARQLRRILTAGR